ncbi:hypothetical protein QUA70_04195 [Microcoleus sp. LAD1_D5]
MSRVIAHFLIDRENHDIKSVSIGIIQISILDLCVNQRQSIVFCG